MWLSVLLMTKNIFFQNTHYSRLRETRREEKEMKRFSVHRARAVLASRTTTLVWTAQVYKIVIGLRLIKPLLIMKLPDGQSFQFTPLAPVIFWHVLQFTAASTAQHMCVLLIASAHCTRPSPWRHLPIGGPYASKMRVPDNSAKSDRAIWCQHVIYSKNIWLTWNESQKSTSLMTRKSNRIVLGLHTWLFVFEFLNIDCKTQ